MIVRASFLIIALGIGTTISAQETAPEAIVNPAIDMDGQLLIAAEAAKHRESRRVTEEEFLNMMHDDGTVVLDARSQDKYAALHIAGAVNLPFPDITVASLSHLLPDK